MTATMARLNRYAYEAMKGVKVDGCTDITGFGLLGHGAEMARAGGVTLEVFAERVPVLGRALEFAAMGILPAGAHNNMDFLANDVMDYSVKLPLEVKDLLYDPQTSGGLLIACKEPELERLQYQLGEKGCENAVVGRFKRRGSHVIEIVNK